MTQLHTLHLLISVKRKTMNWVLIKQNKFFKILLCSCVVSGFHIYSFKNFYTHNLFCVNHIVCAVQFEPSSFSGVITVPRSKNFGLILFYS